MGHFRPNLALNMTDAFDSGSVLRMFFFFQFCSFKGTKRYWKLINAFCKKKPLIQGNFSFRDKSPLMQIIKYPLCHFKNKGCVAVMILHGYPSWFVQNGTFLQVSISSLLPDFLLTSTFFK